MEPGGPGWNDPPKLSYKICSETKTRRNLLNKRVAYLDHSPKKNVEDASYFKDNLSSPPLLKGADVSVQAVTDTKPTPTMFVPSTIPSNVEQMDTVLSECANNEIDDKTTLGDPNTQLDDSNFDMISVLLTLTSDCASKKNQSATNDIRKKVDILKNMLEKNEISSDIVVKMNELTKHLVNRRYQMAWDIHVSLMCDRISEVRLWMVGIKRLINELKGMS